MLSKIAKLVSSLNYFNTNKPKAYVDKNLEKHDLKDKLIISRLSVFNAK